MFWIERTHTHVYTQTYISYIRTWEEGRPEVKERKKSGVNVLGAWIDRTFFQWVLNTYISTIEIFCIEYFVWICYSFLYRGTTIGLSHFCPISGIYRQHLDNRFVSKIGQELKNQAEKVKKNQRHHKHSGIEVDNKNILCSVYMAESQYEIEFQIF